jgi:hypothetical protein
VDTDSAMPELDPHHEPEPVDHNSWSGTAQSWRRRSRPIWCRTLAACSRCGEAKLFDPSNSTGLPTAAWSPIAASTSWSAARRTAAGILLIRENPTSPSSRVARSKLAASSAPQR